MTTFLILTMSSIQSEKSMEGVKKKKKKNGDQTPIGS